MRNREAEENDEITSTMDTVCVNDPMSLCRIKIPARSMNCLHLQCFDLDTFLNINYDIPQWECGICFKKANFEDLIVDGFFDALLKFVPICFTG